MLTFSVLGLVPAFVWVAFAALVTYAALRRVRRRRRPALILEVRNGVALALSALTGFCKDVHVPDDVRPEFERRRARLQETLDAMLDLVARAKASGTDDAFAFWWEEMNLHGSLWALRRFAPVTLNMFRRETAAQIYEWAVHAESAADEQYLLAEERALRLPQEPVCQMALTSLVPARKTLPAAAALVLRPPDGTPAPEDVRRLDTLISDIRRWSAVIQGVNHTTDIPRAADSPVGQPRWMLQ